MTKAHDYAKDKRETFKARFLELLKIKSISTDMAFKDEVLKAANWIADRMKAIGLEANIIPMPEGRHPVVFGTWNGAGENAKTVLIYCHYDVQPAVVADGWHTEPFEPTEKDGKIYARGATDSKVHVMSWLSAVESLMKTEGSSVNIKLLFEGEEESGGKTVKAFVEQHSEKVQADYVVISDGVIRAPQQPSITYGLRGIITFELHVDGPQKDLHSGHFGGTVHNPAQAVAEIIAKLHDNQGKVTVTGFYDDVAVLSDEERAMLAESNAMMEDEWREVANASEQWGEDGYTLHERIGARPTLEINGLYGGYTGDGFKTVLPGHAFAKISCRLVPNQDPEKTMQQVVDYIKEIAPSTIKVSFNLLEMGAPAVLLDYKSDAMQTAYNAYEKGWGIKPVFERAGGSVPITSTMMQITENIGIIGFSYKGGGAHDQMKISTLICFIKA